MRSLSLSRRLAGVTRTDLLVAGAFLVLAEVEAVVGGYDHRVVLALAAAGMTAALAVRRALPLASTVALVAVLAGAGALGATTNTVAVVVAYVVWSYSLAAYADTRRAAVGLAVLLVSSWVAIAVGRDDVGPGDFTFVTILLGGAAALGRALRSRGQEADALAERAERAEAERELRAREAVLEERARIARELHDVVAHSVSVMVVQTGVVRRRAEPERPDDAALLAEVEETGRSALAELRRLLGLLRADAAEVSLDPQPGTDRLEALVEQVLDAGLPVQLRVEGERRPLPAGLDLAAYRIVQEALTNARKHAGPASACVLMTYGDRALGLEVSDDGRGAGPTDGNGHGLVGMRERVALYGGALTTGPRPGGGFLVRATLPYGGEP